MANQIVAWTGASGKAYTYGIYQIPPNFNEHHDGNYIICKITNGAWVPIYIGQGDLKSRASDATHATCAVQKGATHIHANLNSNEQNRLAEEQDLLANYPMAYAPTGCNQKFGG